MGNLWDQQYGFGQVIVFFGFVCVNQQSELSTIPIQLEPANLSLSRRTHAKSTLHSRRINPYFGSDSSFEKYFDHHGLSSLFNSLCFRFYLEFLVKKLIELEESHEHLKQEMSRLKVCTELRQQWHSASPAMRNIGAASYPEFDGVAGGRRSAGKFTNKQYLNILQSVAESVHTL
ncbi:unnamed protein product [Arabis nemorensis]|uniref:Uncharacterized protein n=1 Tax=Arabis nemorensis TaxID=586526 RepID=A0A565B507_9BRAS|nr:unnamed protein product [Arabis nemorensis]